jgi:hypothetical protein
MYNQYVENGFRLLTLLLVGAAMEKLIHSAVIISKNFKLLVCRLYAPTNNGPALRCASFNNVGTRKTTRGSKRPTGVLYLKNRYNTPVGTSTPGHYAFMPGHYAFI